MSGRVRLQGDAGDVRQGLLPRCAHAILQHVHDSVPAGAPAPRLYISCARIAAGGAQHASDEADAAAERTQPGGALCRCLACCHAALHPACGASQALPCART
jgi:hypothetical protein